MTAQLDLTLIERAQWMGLLARAPLDLLEKSIESYTHLDFEILKPFETVAYMVQARTGGKGQRFNMGEVSVAKTIIKLHIPHEDGSPLQKHVGVAYIKSGSERQTFLAAVADALLQDSSHRNTIIQNLLVPLQDQLCREEEIALNKVRATKVEFFTVARENTISSS